MPALPVDTSQIVITASRAPQQESQTPASVTIVDQKRIERLGDPLIPALLRITPSVAVATSGPAGSLTEVRIRGAEANHTLLFVDGIKINDPAAGDQPRFELLNADLASRIEVVRGPQSALWGSEAIGGVIAVNGLSDPAGVNAAAEGGSFGFARASGSAPTAPTWREHWAGSARPASTASTAAGTRTATAIFPVGCGDRGSPSPTSNSARARWPSPAAPSSTASIP